MRRLRVLLLATLLIAVAGSGASAWFYQWYVSPGPLSVDGTLRLPHGTATGAVARLLVEQGTLDRPEFFDLAIWLTRTAGPIRAGEYAVPARISPRDLLTMLRAGRTLLHRLAIPEGLTSAQVTALVAAAPELDGEVGPVPTEGSLLPETYFYNWGDTRRALIERMQRGMSVLLAQLWKSRQPGLPIETPAAALILASIVERETGLTAERPLVAAVFCNRLKLGMRLQSDPTVAYALAGGRGPLGRPLLKADLHLSSPYNTYEIDGLPPGPIANPGRASLEAVMAPAATDALYFVADGSGGHRFTQSAEDHRRNVVNWHATEKLHPQTYRHVPVRH